MHVTARVFSDICKFSQWQHLIRDLQNTNAYGNFYSEEDETQWKLWYAVSGFVLFIAYLLINSGEL